MRASISAATGNPRDSLAHAQKRAEEHPTISTLGRLASLWSELGETARAEELFVSAQITSAMSPPFPLAWLYLQEGLMWQRAGELSRARELFRAARDRLPDYAPAVSHLASIEALTGEREAARAQLRALTQKNDDPEYLAQLAELEPKEFAVKLRAQAQAGFEALLARAPAAFADHAARFYLGAGANPSRALELAQLNLSTRRNAESRTLLIQAALAADARPLACHAASEALDGAPLTLAFKQAIEQGRRACAAPAHGSPRESPLPHAG